MRILSNRKQLASPRPELRSSALSFVPKAEALSFKTEEERAAYVAASTQRHEWRISELAGRVWSQVKLRVPAKGAGRIASAAQFRSDTVALYARLLRQYVSRPLPPGRSVEQHRSFEQHCWNVIKGLRAKYHTTTTPYREQCSAKVEAFQLFVLVHAAQERTTGGSYAEIKEFLKTFMDFKRRLRPPAALSAQSPDAPHHAR